jgi:DNA polymerase/3'-5' exonuclease PolX
VQTGWERISLVAAERYAGQFVALIRDGCVMIEIAGEVRRQQTTIKEPIEIVTVPVIIEQRDLFGERRDDRDMLQEAITRLIATDRLEERVEKHRGKRQPNAHPMRVLFRADGGKLCPINVWTTTPAQFGAVMALRTGPNGLRSGLVTPRQTISPTGRAGLLPRTMQCSERTGLIDRETGAPIETPTEADFFAAVDVEMVPPEARR